MKCKCNKKAKLIKTVQYLGHVWRRYRCLNKNCDNDRFSTRATSKQNGDSKVTTEIVL